MERQMRYTWRDTVYKGLSEDYRSSADALLWRAKLFRFVFLAAIGATWAGVLVYGAGMLDMSYNNYPGDLYTDYTNWWLHVSVLAAVMLGSFTSIVYMQQGGRWSRNFAVIGTVAAAGYLLFGMAVVGKILCECDNIGGIPPGLLHPECPDTSGNPRLAFALRGWAHLGMLISMAIVSGSIFFVIGNVGSLITLIKYQQEQANVSSHIGATLAESTHEAITEPHLLSVYSSPAEVMAVASRYHQHTISGYGGDAESGSLLKVQNSYTLARGKDQ